MKKIHGIIMRPEIQNYRNETQIVIAIYKLIDANDIYFYTSEYEIENKNTIKCEFIIMTDETLDMAMNKAEEEQMPFETLNLTIQEEELREIQKEKDELLKMTKKENIPRYRKPEAREKRKKQNQHIQMNQNENINKSTQTNIEEEIESENENDEQKEEEQQEKHNEYDIMQEIQNIQGNHKKLIKQWISNTTRMMRNGEITNTEEEEPRDTPLIMACIKTKKEFPPITEGTSICKICGKYFQSQDQRNNHIINKHKEENTNRRGRYADMHP